VGNDAIPGWLGYDGGSPQASSVHSSFVRDDVDIASSKHGEPVSAKTHVAHFAEAPVAITSKGIRTAKCVRQIFAHLHTKNDIADAHKTI